jgi:hypothetical protein
MVEKLVKGKGLSCDVAIEPHIHAVYGSQRSVTSIIDAIRRDKLRGNSESQP